MSGADNCYDNAFMESCFGTLKTELEMAAFPSRSEAVRELSSYIRSYNADRRHSSLGYAAPKNLKPNILSRNMRMDCPRNLKHPTMSS